MMSKCAGDIHMSETGGTHCIDCGILLRTNKPANDLRRLIAVHLHNHHLPPSVHVTGSDTNNLEHCTEAIIEAFKTSLAGVELPEEHYHQAEYGNAQAAAFSDGWNNCRKLTKAILQRFVEGL